jgi:hypothetical protein
MGALAGLALLATLSRAQAQEPAPIADNSFLIEEAYNQEARVVQHISAFFRASGGWWYTFTQEWPVGGQRSQLSYTVPLLNGGFGDLALNYRMQVVATEKVAVSPRMSVLLPTGEWQQERGNGTVGFQFNLPVSARVGKRLVTHWNAGATMIPGAPAAGGASNTIWTVGAGASTIYEVRHDFNVLVEVSWVRTSDIFGPDEDIEELFINPGVRWAHTFASGLQIVPGIGVPIGVGPSQGTTAVFLYLSFEHAF